MKNNISMFLKKYCIWVLLIVSTVVSLCLWIFCSKILDFSSLFLNFFVSFSTSIITVAIINIIIDNKRKQELLPIKKSLYIEVAFFLNRLIDMWEGMYAQSIIDREEISVKTLFTEDVINKIYICLDLEGYPPIIPQDNWFNYLFNQSVELKKIGEKILDRYVMISDANLFYNIHYIVNNSVIAGGFFIKMKQIRLLDQSKGIPRIPWLKSYCPEPIEKEYKAFKKLYDWCNLNYKLLEKYDGVNAIKEKIFILNKHTPPTSVMSSEKIISKNQESQEWSKKHSSLDV